MRIKRSLTILVCLLAGLLVADEAFAQRRGGGGSRGGSVGRSSGGSRGGSVGRSSGGSRGSVGRSSGGMSRSAPSRSSGGMSRSAPTRSSGGISRSAPTRSSSPTRSYSPSRSSSPVRSSRSLPTRTSAPSRSTSSPARTTYDYRRTSSRTPSRTTVRITSPTDSAGRSTNSRYETRPRTTTGSTWRARDTNGTSSRLSRPITDPNTIDLSGAGIQRRTAIPRVVGTTPSRRTTSAPSDRLSLTRELRSRVTPAQESRMREALSSSSPPSASAP